MPNHSILLYVEDPLKSAEFYEKLLHAKPIDASPGFAMFALESGVMLGLWARHGVEPAATAAPGASELAFAVEGNAAVEARHRDWVARGLAIAQAPTQLDFGYSFVALDPDGHRLRVFAPTAP